MNVVLRIEHRIGRASLALLIALAAFWGAGRVGGGTPVAGAAPDCYAQTGFCIVNPTIGDYFQHRGGVNTFGYPVTQAFRFEGFLTQFFQRRIVQIGPDGSARLLNVLDPGLMPYTQFNGATIPAPDPQLVAAAPPATDQAAVLAFVQAYTPDVWGGRPVHFYQTFLTTVSAQAAFPAGGGDPRLLPGFDLEMWGMPTSFPMVDPSNYNFVYQRFQRGVMQYDASTGLTQGLLLADYLKSIITGRNLPGDLRSQSQDSALYLQYWPGLSLMVRNSGALPYTNFTGAFVPDLMANTVAGQVTSLNGCEWNVLEYDHYFLGELPWQTLFSGDFANIWPDLPAGMLGGCLAPGTPTRSVGYYLVVHGLIRDEDGSAVIASRAVWDATVDPSWIYPG